MVGRTSVVSATRHVDMETIEVTYYTTYANGGEFIAAANANAQRAGWSRTFGRLNQQSYEKNLGKYPANDTVTLQYFQTDRRVNLRWVWGQPSGAKYGNQ